MRPAITRENRPECTVSSASRVRWLIFALACGTSWVLYLHRYTFNFIKPELAREYGYSETQLGTLFGLFYVTYGLGQIPSGLVCDLSGSRLFLAGIIALWSLALAGFGTTGDSRLLAVYRLVFGGTQAGAYPILAKVSRTWFPLPMRTTMQGIVATTCGRLGGAMSPIIMATLLMGALGLSWRMALLAMTGGGLVFAASFYWLYRESPAEDERVNEAERQLIAAADAAPTGMQTKVEATPQLPWREALRSVNLALLCVQQALAAGADAIYVYLMGSFFLDRYGVQLGSAGLLASLPLIGGAIGGIAGGWLNDRSTRRLGRRWGRSAVGFAGPLVASLAMLLVTRQPTALAAGLGLLVVKFFVDWNQPTVWGAASDLGGRFTGTAFAVVNTAGTVTAIACPMLFGVILDLNTSERVVDDSVVRATNYGPLFVTIAGIYLAGAVTWLFIDCSEPLERQVVVDSE